MSAIKFSNDQSESNVSGILYNERFVGWMYVGTGNGSELVEIYRDPDISHKSWMGEETDSVRWNLPTKSSETAPISEDGETYDYVEGYSIQGGKRVYYGFNSDGGKIYYTLDFGGKKYLCKISVDDVETPNYSMVIPKNTNAYGVVHKITWTGGGVSNNTFEYQTSDSHALFGLETDYDALTNIDYGKWAKEGLTRSGNTYTVSATEDYSPRVLIFRPLQECQINFRYPRGYYCTVENVSTGSSLLRRVLTYTNNKLPSSDPDLGTETYPDDVFKSLPNSLQIKPGTALLVGFFDGNQFDFSEKFDVTPRTLGLQGDANNNKYVTITTDSDVSWTAKITGSSTWFTLSQTSGTGNGGITVTATSANNTGSSRYGSFTITTASGKEYIITVVQKAYETPALIFEDIPSPWSVTSLPNTNTWYVQDSGSMPEYTTAYIPFKVSKSGVIKLSYSGDVSFSSCDAFSLGATISTSNSSFDFTHALAICYIGESSDTYNVTAGTYYLQVSKNITNSVMLNLELSFTAS